MLDSMSEYHVQRVNNVFNDRRLQPNPIGEMKAQIADRKRAKQDQEFARQQAVYDSMVRPRP